MVTVTTPDLTVDNAGSPLEGSDVILVANQSLNIAANADIQASGSSSTPAQALQISDPISLQPAKSASTATSASTLSITRGGTSIVLTQGIPSGDELTSDVAGTYTLPGASGAASFTNGSTLANLPAGSSISLSSAGTLTAIGSGAPISIASSDGALLRVSSSAVAMTERPNVVSYSLPSLQVGQDATISGATVTMDSTQATTIDPSAVLSGGISLSSGQISILLDNSVPSSAVPSSLVLTPATLADFQSNATTLSLLSYSSIDTYGAGTIGSPSLLTLSLHAAEIRGFQSGISGQPIQAGSSGEVRLSAQTVVLDDSPNGNGPGPITGSTPAGTLEVSAGTIDLGANPLAIDQFANVNLTATNGIEFQDSGRLTASGNLTMTTPQIAGAGVANETITAGGSLTIIPLTATSATPLPGLGTSLTLMGSSVTIGSEIALPSGNLTIEAFGPLAAGGNVAVSGALELGGTAGSFNNANVFTNGGQVDLISDNGSVTIMPGGYVNVSAQPGGGSAGGLSVSAINGTFSVDSPTASSAGNSMPTLDAGGSIAGSGLGGAFSLDVSGLSNGGGESTTSLSPLETALSAGGFTLSQTLRVRNGDVLVDNSVTAHAFNLSADSGNIEVTSSGTINASGATGGSINLYAGGSVSLDGGSVLTVQGNNFSDSGQGGTVTLQAGSFTDTALPTDTRNTTTGLFAGGAAIDIGAGSAIDLSVVNGHALQLNPGGASSSTPAGSITVPAGTTVYFPSGTPGSDEVSFTCGGAIVAANGVATTFTASALRPYVTALASGTSVTFSGSGTIAYSGGPSGSIPISLPYETASGAVLSLSAVNVTDLGAYNSSGVLNLIAPQVFNMSGDPVDVRIDPIQGKITGASAIMVEGVEVFNLTPAAGTSATIDATVESSVQLDGAMFAGGLIQNASGKYIAAAGNTSAIVSSLAGGNLSLGELMHVLPEAEIVNTSGDLVLDTTWDFTQGASYTGVGDPSVASNWRSLAMPFRFGPNDNEPGVLVLRAAGNVVLSQNADNGTFGSLSDGFAGFDGADNITLEDAKMLPAGYKSWSFELVSGADFTAADVTRVLPESILASALQGTGSGSIILGGGSPDLSTFEQNDPSVYFETIRTGTGSIGLYAGLNVEFVDNLFSVYTAGTQTNPLANFGYPGGNSSLAEFSTGGGDVDVVAQGSIEHLNAEGQADSSKELPLNWIVRQGAVDPTSGIFMTTSGGLIGDSTAWWVAFNNFFEGIGALGGGNVTLTAGGSISNVDAVIPTNERTSYETSEATTGSSTIDKLASDQATLELGGGDLLVQAGQDISGGVYYVERGQGTLVAGGSILTNGTRAADSPVLVSAIPSLPRNPDGWLPTTLFLGNGNFSVQAGGDVLLGPVTNLFLLPQASGNGPYFSTYGIDSVSVSSLAGSVTLKDDPDFDQGGGGAGSLSDWLGQVLALNSPVNSIAAATQPWLGLEIPRIAYFDTLVGVMPSSLYATAFNGDINLEGAFTLLPSANGQIALVAAGSINGLQPNSVSLNTDKPQWASSVISLSDADPTRIPGLADPIASSSNFISVDSLFAVSGSITGAYAVLQTQAALHAPELLHADDPIPLEIYASGGNISGLTLYSGKSADVAAGQDITDVGLYVQNDSSADITTVSAGRNLVPYDPTSALRTQVSASGGVLIGGGSGAAGPGTGNPTAGDIQISGPGTLEVLAGGNVDLGETVGSSPTDGTSTGITSIGNSANPYLPFQGAGVVVSAGLPGLNSLIPASPGLADSKTDFSDFIAAYVNPQTAQANAATYVPELAQMLGASVPAASTPQDIWQSLLEPYSDLPAAAQQEHMDLLAADIFYLVLRDAGRNQINPDSPFFGTYSEAYAAIQTLFPGSPTGAKASETNPLTGNITLATRLIETTNGGDIGLLAPYGSVTVGRANDPQKPDQGILTEHGGSISIEAESDVEVGTSRIFTLRGGNEIIWSSLGDIAAGSGSKTVHSAPPTRVLIDPQSAVVQNDLAGLATGSGIGVLATLAGVAPGNVDLVAPVGTVDAGDAGIRASGNVSIAALHVLNATNIQASGATTGVPVVAAPNIGALTSASSTNAAASGTAAQVASQQQSAVQTQETVVPSLIDVEVLGYGGGEDFT